MPKKKTMHIIWKCMNGEDFIFEFIKFLYLLIFCKIYVWDMYNGEISYTVSKYDNKNISYNILSAINCRRTVEK